MRPYRAEPPDRTSRRMAAVPNRNTTAEIALRHSLWRLGVRYRLHLRNLPGTPDLALVAKRIAIFVDGDFWHGRVFRRNGIDALRATFRGARQDYWTARILRNAHRDDDVDRQLTNSGWTVLRVWERDVNTNAPRMAAIVLREIKTERPAAMAIRLAL